MPVSRKAGNRGRSTGFVAVSERAGLARQRSQGAMGGSWAREAKSPELCWG